MPRGTPDPAKVRQAIEDERAFRDSERVTMPEEIENLTREEVINRLAKHPPDCYLNMAEVEYGDGVSTMLSDLEMLAKKDGCVAAAWALKFAEMVAEWCDPADEKVTV